MTALQFLLIAAAMSLGAAVLAWVGDRWFAGGSE